MSTETKSTAASINNLTDFLEDFYSRNESPDIEIFNPEEISDAVGVFSVNGVKVKYALECKSCPCCIIFLDS